METLLILGAAAGALVAIGVAIRKGYIAAREFFALQTAAARLVAAEMTTNSGGSLLDKVNKIKPNHEAAEAHWTALRKQQDAMTLRLVAVEDAVSTHGVVPCVALETLQKRLAEAGLP